MKTITGFNLRSFLLAAAFLAGLGGVSHVSARPYLVDLHSRTATGVGEPWEAIIANAITDAGQVVGYFPHDDAFITGPDGVGVRVLGAGFGSVAKAINQAGQVAGDPGAFGGAFITGPDGRGVRGLGSFDSYFNYTVANAINDAGQVAGYSDLGNGTLHAFITGPDGMGIRDLGTLGGYESFAYGINDTGRVAGWSRTADGTGHAFITGPDGVGMRDLGTLGGDSSLAYGINAAGQVVGQAGGHAFITGPDGVGMRDLGTLGGISRAYSINDAGQVVGWLQTAGGDYHAFITGPNEAGMTDLNSLVELPEGIVLTAARGINNAGQIIASGVYAPIPPVPEPESYALLLAGLTLIAAVIRRKKSIGSLPTGAR